jgi:putative MATE family efflux protein
MVRTTDLTKGPVAAELFRLTLPMLMGMFAMMTFNLADTYFISRLGTDELAAMTFTFPVIMVIISIALGIGVGTSSVISRVVGNGDHERVRRLTTDGLLLAALTGAFFMAAGLLTMRPVFHAMGADGRIYELVVRYMRIWYLGAGFVFVPIAVNNAIRGSGDMLMPGLVMTGASLLNIALDPIFIFGLWGVPRFGLAGAALATVITRGLSLVAALLILNSHKRMLSFSLPRAHEVLRSWKELLYVGFPASATNLLFSVTMGVITRIVSLFGPAAVAAVGAGVRVESMFLIVYFAMMSATVPFVGQNWGAQRYARVHTAQKELNRFAFLWGVAGFIFFLVFADRVGAVFSSERGVVDRIAIFLVISSLGYAFRGVCMVSVAFFNGINMPVKALKLNLLRMFGLYVPLASAGARFFGFKGIFIGMTAANVLAGGLAFIWVKNTCKACEPSRIEV